MTKVEYEAYLQSMRWNLKRLRALDRAMWRCERCELDDEPLEVHHRTYARVGRERARDLIVLCETCHSARHARRFQPAPGQLRLPLQMSRVH